MCELLRSFGKIVTRFEFTVSSIEDLVPAFKWASELLRMGLPGGPMALYVDRPRRSKEQNDRYWAALADISKQVEWNGVKLTKEDWRDLFTAAIRKQRLVPGLDGGLVVIGGHSSRMNREEFSEMIELVYSVGTEKGVVWSEPAEKELLAAHVEKIKA